MCYDSHCQAYKIQNFKFQIQKKVLVYRKLLGTLTWNYLKFKVYYEL